MLAPAALALLLAPPDLLGAARGGVDPRLQILGEEFVARSQTRAATRGGGPSSVSLAPTVAAATWAEELVWLRGFRGRLAALPHQEPAGERAAERALLDAAVERALLELEVLRPFQRDPGAYVALVAGSVDAALQGSGSPCARLQHAARRLAEVPEVLRAARLNLVNPPRILTELAIERFAEVLRFYREDVPGLAAGCRSAHLQADFAQADTFAVRSVETFLSYLEDDLLPASRGELAIGPDACRRLLRASLLAEVAPIETLLAEATRLVETRRAELEALAPIVETGGGRAVFHPFDPEPAPEAGAVPRVRRALARVEEFLRRRDVVSIPPRPALSVRAAPSFRTGAAPRLADPGGRAEPRPSTAWLEVAALAPPGGGAGLAGFDRSEIDLAVAHEGLPGRYLRAIALRGASSRPFRTLQETWPAEDWGEYCERMLLEQGYGAEDSRYRRAGAARALRHAGRALAALALHSSAMTLEEARRMLEDRCLLDPAQAGREARWAAAEPAIMGHALGAQRLRELQEEARRRLGPRFRTRAFLDAVLRCGASPPGIVSARLWRELAEATGDVPAGAGP